MNTDLAHRLSKHPQEVETLLKEPSRWLDLTDEELYYFVFGSIALYGVTNDEARIPALQDLYEFYQTRIDVGGRLELMASVDEVVGSGKCSATAFFPFLFHDETEAVVATATMDFASRTPQEDGDPMTGPKMLLQYFVEGRARRRQGIFAGLTLLGDRRVYELLESYRDDLTDDELRDVTMAFHGVAHAAAIEFYLDWLEQTDDEGSPTRFAHLCAALARIGRDALPRPGQTEPIVVDVERAFPVTDEKQPVRYVREYLLREYADIIAPRLRALARAEHGERLVPRVMELWGIVDDSDHGGRRVGN